MRNNSNIKDFFKPVTRPQKHSRHDEPQNDPDAEILPRSKSPKVRKIIPTEVTEASAHSETSRVSYPSPLGSHQDKDISAQGAAELLEPSSTDIEPKLTESSFTSNLSSFSSQRVVKNGETMVTNSDDELDSDDSLEDIDELLCQRHSHVHSSTEQTDNYSTKLRESYKIQARNMRSNHLFKSSEGQPKHKFSLDFLTARIESDKKLEDGREQALLCVEESDDRIRRLEERFAKDNISNDQDPAEMASMMLNRMEDNGIERIMQAMERTEVLQSKKNWSFFTSGPINKVSLDFPSISGGILEGTLGIEVDREAAFVGGFLSDFAIYGLIPDNVLDWMISVVPVEHRIDLQEAYHDIFKMSPAQTASLLDINRLEILFRSLGASEEAMSKECSLEPMMVSPLEAVLFGEGWKRLGSVLRLLSAVVESMSHESCTRALSLILRLAVDVGFDAHADLLLALQKTVAALFDSIPEKQIDINMEAQIIELVAHLKDTQLRLHLLRNLASPHLLTCTFRKRLALAFFCEKVDLSFVHDHQKISLSDIYIHLRQPNFEIRSDMDFSVLQASIETLDIAIDDAGRPSKAEADAQVSFNEDVDRLAQAIKNISTKIRDTGANHLSRTEAKEALEALHARLEYTVRTKPKSKRSIFGDTKAKSSREQQDFMSRYINMTKP